MKKIETYALLATPTGNEEHGMGRCGSLDQISNDFLLQSREMLGEQECCLVVTSTPDLDGWPHEATRYMCMKCVHRSMATP